MRPAPVPLTPSSDHSRYRHAGVQTTVRGQVPVPFTVPNTPLPSTALTRTTSPGSPSPSYVLPHPSSRTTFPRDGTSHPHASDVLSSPLGVVLSVLIWRYYPPIKDSLSTLPPFFTRAHLLFYLKTHLILQKLLKQRRKYRKRNFLFYWSWGRNPLFVKTLGAGRGRVKRKNRKGREV